MNQDSPVAPAPPPKSESLRERKKARTRRSIQRHTLRLMEEYGFADTTVEMIAEAAEISPSTFFRYFRNKEEAAVTDFVSEDLYQEILRSPAEMGILEAIAHGLRKTAADLAPEDWHYQQIRTQLIMTVPELQRGVMESMISPIRFATTLAAQRLHLPEESFEAKMFGGAIVGALLGLMVPEDGLDLMAQSAEMSQEDMVGLLEAGIGMLTAVIRLPEPEAAPGESGTAAS